MNSLIASDFTIEQDISNNLLYSSIQDLIVPFWTDNPNVLLQGKYITEFFPVSEMTYNQKLNAISRTILMLTIVLFILYRRFHIILIGAMTLGSVFLLHYYRQKECQKKANIKNKIEGFENPALAVLKGSHINAAETFDKPTDTNPFSNVLLPDYDYNPHKKPAPPAFNTNVNQTILEQAKQLVVDQNPGQPDIANKLFTDLGEQFVFEQSLQPFYSNPATTIPNDQAGFADFCYGSMVSCKEGNMFACARNLDRHTN
jgi:hypothetical protein